MGRRIILEICTNPADQLDSPKDSPKKKRETHENIPDPVVFRTLKDHLLNARSDQCAAKETKANGRDDNAFNRSVVDELKPIS